MQEWRQGGPYVCEELDHPAFLISCIWSMSVYTNIKKCDKNCWKEKGSFRIKRPREILVVFLWFLKTT